MVSAKVQYLAEASEHPVYYASAPGRNAQFTVDQGMKYYQVEVEDARSRSTTPNDFDGQDASGFDLLESDSAVTNFLDQHQIEGPYEEELRALIKSHTGAYRVEFFDHTVRASDPDIRQTKQIREPATLVHNDYTANSGFTCLNENLGDEAEALSKTRFQIINVWRPLVDPVENFPLALCDVRSVNSQDVIDAERRAPNHIGEISLAIYNPDHRWYYFSSMRPSEVLLFKTFDSINQGKTNCSIHTAIDLPDATANNARPRESIESRAFVFYRE
ncbi:MAG: methyltransferase [Gammaproteobacteria bacterium]|nr:methyltransferase [Gammaproteobacteria bacterium]